LDVIREKDAAKKNSVGVIKVKFYRERKKRVNLCSEKANILDSYVSFSTGNS